MVQQVANFSTRSRRREYRATSLTACMHRERRVNQKLGRHLQGYAIHRGEPFKD